MPLRAPAPQAGASAYFATSTWTRDPSRGCLDRQQEAERDDSENPNQRKHGCNAVQVLFCSCRAKCCSPAATEHVGEPAAAAAVQKNANDHGDHGDHIDDECEVLDDVAHGLKRYQSGRFSADSGDSFPEDRANWGLHQVIEGCRVVGVVAGVPSKGQIASGVIQETTASF